MMGMNTAFSDPNTPLFYTYSGGRQNWYNVGVSIAIPFDDFFDRPNRIHRQQLKTKATQVEMEKWHDDQKMKIIEVYTKAVKELSVLRLKAESLLPIPISNLPAEFLNGNSGDLNQIKSMQMDARIV